MGRAKAEDYYDQPPRDPLEAQLQLETATIAEVLSDAGRRAVAVLSVVVGEDGETRCCALLSGMAEDEREQVAEALITALQSEFGGKL